MIVLAIETATTNVGCAIADDDGTRSSFQASHGRRHAETLVPAIRFCCSQAGVEVHDIGAIAVDVGPGLFTGLRVGVATAKAMATALGVPVVGLPSLDLLAYPARFTSRLIVPVIDARRGGVFWATFTRSPGGVQRRSGLEVSEPDELAEVIEATGERCLLVGDGAIRYSGILGGRSGATVADGSFSAPSATTLVELAAPLARRGETVGPDELAPVYLRSADANINWDVRRPARARAGPGGAC